MSTYTIPNVIARHPHGERIMDVYSHLLTERIIYLGTAIDAGVANALVAQLLHLEADSPESDIQLYINCEGGDPSAMLAVYDTLRYIRPQVATTCVGQAVAVGAVLLAAGAPGKRAALPHTRVVLHQPMGQGRGRSRTSSSRRTRSSVCARTSSASSPGTPGRRPRRCAPTPIATACSPRSRRWTTASSTTSSRNGTRSPRRRPRRPARRRPGRRGSPGRPGRGRPAGSSRPRASGRRASRPGRRRPRRSSRSTAP